MLLLKSATFSPPPPKHITNMWIRQPLYAGLAVTQSEDGEFNYSVALHDGTYTISCTTKPLFAPRSTCNSSDESTKTASDVSTPASEEDIASALVNAFVGFLKSYREERLSKPMGAGMTAALHRLSPHLPVRLWAELDILPFVFPVEPNSKDEETPLPIDQQAEYMARKTVKRFNVKGELPVQMGHRRQVLVDLDGRVKIADLDSYRDTVRADTTGAATMHYVNSLKKNKVKIAFFNR